MPHVKSALNRATLSGTLLPLALICAGACNAQVGPVTSFELVSTVASNIGADVSSSQQFGTHSYGYTDIRNVQSYDSPRSVIQPPPGIGTPGLALDYIDHISSYDLYYFVEKAESGYVTMTASDAQPINFSGGKYLQVTGHLNATQDTDVNFNVHANGSYLPTTTPVGPGVPALPTFYLSVNGTSITSPFTDISTDPGDTPSSYSLFAQTSSVSLLANTPFSFTAMLYAGDNVSLHDFDLQFSTSYYGLTTAVTPQSNTTSELVGAHLLAPVPEPETYAMLLGGLALLGCLCRRQRRGQPG
jgi:hypothetical protein